MENNFIYTVLVMLLGLVTVILVGNVVAHDKVRALQVQCDSLQHQIDLMVE